jgi:MFS superfamily sulfate permease-like transporter
MDFTIQKTYYQLLYLSESDLIPGIGTFVACLVLRLEIGILVGIGINILFILYHAARPKIAIENQVVSIITSIKCLQYT